MWGSSGNVVVGLYGEGEVNRCGGGVSASEAGQIYRGFRNTGTSILLGLSTQLPEGGGREREREGGGVE